MADEKIIIPFELYSSKNSRRILKAGNRTIVAKSKKAKEQEEILTAFLWLERKKWQELIKGKEFPLRLSITIYRQTKRRWDWVNIVQNLFDCMVKAGWLPDDDVEHLTPIFESWSVDSKNPRAELRVL